MAKITIKFKGNQEQGKTIDKEFIALWTIKSDLTDNKKFADLRKDKEIFIYSVKTTFEDTEYSSLFFVDIYKKDSKEKEVNPVFESLVNEVLNTTVDNIKLYEISSSDFVGKKFVGITEQKDTIDKNTGNPYFAINYYKAKSWDSNLIEEEKNQILINIKNLHNGAQPINCSNQSRFQKQQSQQFNNKSQQFNNNWTEAINKIQENTQQPQTTNNLENLFK